MYEQAPPPSDKGKVWSLPARAEDQVKTTARALKERKLPPAAILDGRFNLADPLTPQPDPPGLLDPDAGVVHDMTWGDPPTKRLMIKVACELIAYNDPVLGRASELKDARMYAQDGIGDFRMVIDTSTEGSQLSNVVAPFVHASEVWSRNGTLNHRFTLFTYFTYAGVLTKNWRGPKLRYFYGFDCTDPKNMTARKDDGDGDMLTQWSVRDSDKAFLEQSAKLSEALRVYTPEINAYRANSLTAAELYDGVCELFKRDPWPIDEPNR